MVVRPDYVSEVVIKETKPLNVVYLHLRGDPQKLYDQNLLRLLDWMERHNIAPETPGMAIFYTDRDEVGPDNVEWDMCIPVRQEVKTSEDIKFKTLSRRRVASTIVTGPYTRIVDGYNYLIGWADERGLKLDWPLVEIYHKCPPEYDEEEFETELQLKVNH